MTEAYTIFPVAGDLPLEVSRFVGRRFDRGRIRELVAGSRLVTLTGFGGIGKTRLALRTATELRRSFGDVFVVPLGGLSSREAVPDQIAAAMGLHGLLVQSSTIAVVEYLRARRALLVLDNCEHLIESVAVVADTILRTCSGVHILATSREPLRIAGEVVFPVAPLSVPEQLSNEGPLHQYEGVELFLDRARAVVPDFAITDDNRAAVAAISRRLEGIPLAIELAAAQLRAFSPTELSAQLTDAWEFPGRRSRTAPGRHSTIAACIEWSFNLCSPAEQSLWAKASVFADGFDLDAARSVCAAPDDEQPIEQTLAALVEKSVVIATSHAMSSRYRMLAPIRHRGREELVRIGQDVPLRRRHKDFYIALVERAHDAWFGPRQLDWIDRLRLEAGNLSKALEWCAAEPESADQGLRAFAELREFGTQEGHFQRARGWFDRLIGGPPGDPEIRALALRTAAWWAAIQGDTDSATRMVDEARALANKLGGQTEALLDQAAGFVAIQGGDFERAEKLIEAAGRRLASAGNDAERADCSVLLAFTRMLLGDARGALEHHRECLAITEAAGEVWLRSWSLFIAALALWRLGDTAAAREQAAESLRLKRRLGDTFGIAFLLETLAWFAAGTDPERAVLLLGAARNQWDKVDTTAEVLPVLRTPHRETTSATRTQLGEPNFEVAWSCGRALDQAAAIALALDEPKLPAPHAAGEESPNPLTRRQRQVARLIHKGLSNKEIAETLVISPRTAETHVENILTTLGFTSRAQIARWFGELPESGDQ